MRCPNCGGETDANLLFCRHCGERIDLIQQNGQMPNGQPGGESSPYSRGGGNNYNPYSGHGNGGRSPGDILMIAIGTVLALAAVGIAVFIMTHMVGDGGTVTKKDSSVSVESEKAESKNSNPDRTPHSDSDRTPHSDSDPSACRFVFLRKYARSDCLSLQGHDYRRRGKLRAPSEGRKLR